ncbi:hypothetical protein F4778DRAFT_753135 [Xylariomycetidae sp. FL2044]|nr:hypothetical protein F4778DRAFT_753135 [Xylariomycetidae sp. FL2044]
MNTMKRFALVTGCGQGGIGEALVMEFKRQGVTPLATVLPNESRDHLIHAGIECFSLDVTNELSVAQLKTDVQACTGGQLDVLVNNAGICYTMTAVDTDVAEVKRMFDVNVFGPMQMVHHFHDLLIKTAGKIVNIGSVGGIVPYLYGSSYNASKAALHHWSNTMRVEMAPLDVKVITVISGEIGTNILNRDRDRQLPKGSVYSPLSEEFQKHVQRVPNTTDRFEYAEKVVLQCLSSSPPAWFWYGKTTLFVRLLDTFAWRTIWDSVMGRMFGLSRLKQ